MAAVAAVVGIATSVYGIIQSRKAAKRQKNCFGRSLLSFPTPTRTGAKTKRTLNGCFKNCRALWPLESRPPKRKGQP